MIRRPTASPSGTAAVEFALVAPLMFSVLLGLWEAGRMIQLQQILQSAAREGARVAAQSIIINSTGSPTQIQVSTGSPNVKQTVVNYLNRAGLNLTTAQVTVTFQFITGNTSLTQPYQGIKNQQFRVTVTIPIASLQWSFVGLYPKSSLTAEAVWATMVDDPFTLDESIPSW